MRYYEREVNYIVKNRETEKEAYIMELRELFDEIESGEGEARD